MSFIDIYVLTVSKTSPKHLWFLIFSVTPFEPRLWWSVTGLSEYEARGGKVSLACVSSVLHSVLQTVSRVSTDNISDLVKYYQCHNPVNTVRGRSDNRDQSATHRQHFSTHYWYQNIIKVHRDRAIGSFIFCVIYFLISMSIKTFGWILSFWFPLYCGVCHSPLSAPPMTPTPWVSGEDRWRKFAAVAAGLQESEECRCCCCAHCVIIREVTCSRNTSGPGDSPHPVIQHFNIPHTQQRGGWCKVSASIVFC